MTYKGLSIAALFLLLIYTSCSKITESLQRDVVIVDTVYFEIPVIPNIGDEATLPDIATTIDLEAQIKAQVQDLTASNLLSARLKNLHLALAEVKKDSIDIDNNFANLQSIKFSLTDGSKTDSLANITIPSTNLIGALALTPVILPETLKPQLSNPSMKYRITVKAKKATVKVMNVRAAASYIVTLAK
ncbi:hypothetical protein [Pedobacter heparinus]|uniref:hypothetical protein n=1 Tax=Pedobacter heparinus TaxID=984 RepID=UPI00292F09A4|nr:hypothetical protein [Pedobacter heparinus]